MTHRDTPRTLEEAVTRLGDWTYEMWRWGRRVREDILAVERKLGMPKGDPGDPPEPPWDAG